MHTSNNLFPIPMDILRNYITVTFLNKKKNIKLMVICNCMSFARKNNWMSTHKTLTEVRLTKASSWMLVIWFRLSNLQHKAMFNEYNNIFHDIWTTNSWNIGSWHIHIMPIFFSQMKQKWTKYRMIRLPRTGVYTRGRYYWV